MILFVANLQKRPWSFKTVGSSDFYNLCCKLSWICSFFLKGCFRAFQLSRFWICFSLEDFYKRTESHMNQKLLSIQETCKVCPLKSWFYWARLLGIQETCKVCPLKSWFYWARLVFYLGKVRFYFKGYQMKFWALEYWGWDIALLRSSS